MTIKETQEHLNNLAPKLPMIPFEKIKDLKLNHYSNNKYYMNERNWLYKWNGIYWIIEVEYTPIPDKGIYKATSQRIISAMVNGKIYKNAYYVMSKGYMPNYNINFTHSRIKFNNYTNRELLTFQQVYKAENWIRKMCNNLFDINNTQWETLYKEGLGDLKPNTYIKSQKPRIALGLELLSKQQFKEFKTWHKQFKNFDLNIYKDFLTMAKNRKHKDIFAINWLELHDIWSGIVEQKKNEQLYKQDKNIWKKVSKISITPINSKNEMKEFGTEMNNCLQTVKFNYKHIFKIESWETSTPLALEWENGQIKQLYGYKNGEVPKNINTLVKNTMEKEVENGRIQIH